MLASGDKNQKVHIWDVEKGEVKHMMTGHCAPVSGIGFSQDEEWLASCGTHEHTIRRWVCT